MQKFIVAIWALVAIVSAEFVRDERDIGISSGYGGSFGYINAPSAASISKLLQSSAEPHINNANKEPPLIAISNGYGGAYGYTSTPEVNSRNQPSSHAVSSGYGGEYGYIPIPKAISKVNNKNQPSNHAISSGYGGEYGYIPISKVVNTKKKLQTVAIPSAYGGAFGYGLSDAAISNGYSFTLPSNVNVKSHSQSDIPVSSGYGGAYGYSSTFRVTDSKDLSSNDVDPGRYKSSPMPVVSVNSVKVMDISQAMNEEEMVLMPKQLHNYLPGYSGYGRSISSYSGYSRTRSYPGYGFAYANGWL